jgi:diguanylate cyclase (GGDEF)-like protein/PAS domain S-box-containing protein
VDGHPDPELFQRIVERSVYVYLVVDVASRIRYVSPSCLELFGYDIDKLVGTLALDLVRPEDQEAVAGALADLLGHPGEGVPIVAGIVHQDGSTVFIEMGANAELDNPVVAGIMVRIRPYNDQRLLDDYLEVLAMSVPLEQTLQPLIESIRAQHIGCDVAVAYDWDGSQFRSAVDTGLPAALTGRSDPSGAGHLPWIEALRSGQPALVATTADLDPTILAITEAAGLAACWAYPVPVPPDGTRLACLIVWRPTPGPPMLGHKAALDRSVRLAALGFERRHGEDLLRHAALHDTLTGIPNRSHFFQALDRMLALPGVARSAVLFGDLDGFKDINDTHGHGIGDEVLAIVAKRLQANIRPGDMAARVGGDEFAVLCGNLASDGQAIGVADRLIEAVGQPITVGAITVSVGLSIGLAFHDPTRQSELALIDAADHALYQAKQAGKNHWVVAAPT